MAKAYLVVARNDIDNNMLQVLDLQPNTSQRNPIYEGAGQTGYLAYALQNDVVAAYGVGGGGEDTMTGDTYGLAAYLVDNVKDLDNGDVILTPARANAIAGGIEAAITAGTALTLAAIDALIQAATGGALSGLTADTSTGTVEQVLRICGGEVYKVTDASIMSGPASAWLEPAGTHTPIGGFVVPVVVNGVTTYPSDWRNVRIFVDTGMLHLSRASGHLSALAAATYVWENPSFTYGAGGTGQFIDGTAIPATHIGRALVVYDATGAVITT